MMGFAYEAVSRAGALCFEFRLLTTNFVLAFSIGVALLTLFFCFLSFSRSGYKTSVLCLEIVRFAVVLLFLFTLNQPEWVQEEVPDERPVIAVLQDGSKSMATADGLPGAVELREEERKTRTQRMREFVEAQSWDRLSEEHQLVFETFSHVAEEEVSSVPGTDLTGPLQAVMSAHPSLRAVVLLSDGDWNQGGTPVQAAATLRSKRVPVFTIPVGQETPLPDVALTAFDAPTFAVSSKPVELPFTVRSTMPRSVSVRVTLSTSTGHREEKEFEIEARGILEEVFKWKPTQSGPVDLELTVDEVKGEFVPSNNQRTADLEVRDESLKVLVVESWPRWEYRYLRNALMRDPGVEVSCLLFHPDLEAKGGGKGYLTEFPASQKELSEYDVVFLGDVGIGPRQLSEENCAWLKGIVEEQACGVVFIPGFRGYQSELLATDLDEIYPVQLDEAQPGGFGSALPYSCTLTTLGRSSLLTKLASRAEDNAVLWRRLPGFQWYAPVVRAKVGASVLAVHGQQSNEYGRLPLLVTQRHGTGKVLFLGTDGAWRWREGVEDLYHYRFWGQVVRWMAYQRHMAAGQSMRMWYAPERPETGNLVTLFVNAMDPSGEPLREANITATLEAPSGATDTVRFESGGEEWGLFKARFTPQEAGRYIIRVSSRESGEVLEASLSVHGSELEPIGEAARHDVLREIAKVSRGEFLQERSLDGLVDTLAALPGPDPIQKRFQLWCHPYWAVALISLLAIFWIGRKMTGTI